MEFSELFTQAAHDEGAEVRIKNPITGKDTDVFIKVMGVDSKQYRLAQKKATNRFFAALGGGKTLTEEEQLELDTEQLVAVTIGWRGIAEGGKPKEFTPQACKELYTKSPGLAQQVNRFVTNHTNFTKG